MSYKLTIPSQDVQKTLSTHILADGYDLTFDMEASQGVYMVDAKHQRRLLDFFTCFASVPLGYNHPSMLEDEEFKKSLFHAALTNPSNSDIYTREYAQFVKTFGEVGIPDYLPHAFFIAGGGLAVENAIKIAMDWKVQKNFQKGYTEEKGHQVIHFKEAFHGRTGYTMSLTNTQADKTKWFAKFNWPRINNPYLTFPMTDEVLEDVKQREQQAIAQMEEAFQTHQDDICAIIIEPIQSEGGDHHFRTSFMEELRRLADQHEALLIYDEVQTGVGLTGTFWCHEQFGPNARPDLLAFGKKMQICGVLAGPRIDEIETNVFKVPSRINSTWGGNLVDMVRSTKILQIIHEDGLLDHAKTTGSYLLAQLEALSKDFPMVSNVRGRGLLCAFDLPDKATRDAFVTQGMEKGALFLGCGPRTIRFRPALIIQQSHIDKGIQIMRDILQTFS
jgi:L-lysine 6-transaminase